MEAEIQDHGGNGNGARASAACSVQTPQRVKFETEIEVIRQRYGSLEQMRARIGLSRRRLCEHLMVDPSAWSRWVSARGGDSAPPHVYRTLALLIERFESHEVASSVDPTQLSQTEMRWRESFELQQQNLRQELWSHLDEMKLQLNRKEELTLGWKFFLLINFVLILYVLIR